MPCYICGKTYASMDIHHKKMQAFGGLDTEDNRKELCPTHHDLVHKVANALKKSVFKADDIISVEFKPYSEPYIRVMGLAREALASEIEGKEGTVKKEMDIKITVPIALHAKIKDYAKANKVSMNSWLVELLKRTVK